MRRLLTASALFALALAVVATGHEPAAVYRERTVIESDYPFPFQFTRAQPAPKGADDKKPLGEKVEKKADPTDAAIAAALANDPDVRMAKAKIQLAEAELTKARQVVTLKVVMLKAKIDQLKTQIGPLEEQLAVVNKLHKTGVTPLSEVLPVREKLEAAKAALALAETEWKLLTGPPAAGASGAATDPNHAQAVASALKWFGERQTADADTSARLWEFIAARERAEVKGPIPDRIRAALDKSVKLGAKGEKVTFAQAAAAVKKDAGLDVPVREFARMNAIVSEGD